MKKNFIIAITVCICSVMFFACSPKQPKHGEDGTADALPVKIKAHGSSYTIAKYEIGKTDEGKTVVKISGKGCGKTIFMNDESVFPIMCAFTAYGLEYNPQFVISSKKEKEYEYHFDTWAVPDTIIVYSAEDKNNNVKISCRPTKTDDNRFPVTIQAYENSYTVTGFELMKNEKGNTDIVIIGKGVNQFVEINDASYLPIKCAFTSGGQEYTSDNFAIPNQYDAGYVIYHFDTWAIPQTVILYPSNDASKRIEVKCD